MKPTNYQALTNDELDKLAAEMMGPTFFNYISHLSYNDGRAVIEVQVCPTKDIFKWNPTDPDNNQVERYLFPKLKEDEWLNIETGYLGPFFGVEISRHHLIIERSAKGDVSDMLAEVEVNFKDNPNQINRTKLIACLEAWDKLEEK